VMQMVRPLPSVYGVCAMGGDCWLCCPCLAIHPRMRPYSAIFGID
jgi:hypothetical protein